MEAGFCLVLKAAIHALCTLYSHSQRLSVFRTCGFSAERRSSAAARKTQDVVGGGVGKAAGGTLFAPHRGGTWDGSGGSSSGQGTTFRHLTPTLSPVEAEREKGCSGQGITFRHLTPTS